MSVASKNVLVLLKKNPLCTRKNYLGTDRLLRLGGGWEGGGLQFSKRLDFRGSILKMDKCEGDRNIKTQNWPSM